MNRYRSEETMPGQGDRHGPDRWDDEPLGPIHFHDWLPVEGGERCNTCGRFRKTEHKKGDQM